MLAHFCEGCSKYSSIKTKLFRICGWQLKSWATKNVKGTGLGTSQ